MANAQDKTQEKPKQKLKTIEDMTSKIENLRMKATYYSTLEQRLHDAVTGYPDLNESFVNLLDDRFDSKKESDQLKQARKLVEGIYESLDEGFACVRAAQQANREAVTAAKAEFIQVRKDVAAKAVSDEKKAVEQAAKDRKKWLEDKAEREKVGKENQEAKAKEQSERNELKLMREEKERAEADAKDQAELAALRKTAQNKAQSKQKSAQ